MADAVVIGRNEGARLAACLASLQGRVRRIVYADSGSTDGSPEAAEAAGATVVRLSPDRPFTAARGRNAGLAVLAADPQAAPLVQFVDGDCVLDPRWLPAAMAFLEAHPQAVAVCGRRREMHPEASPWNRLIDREWDTPVGQARACGGSARPCQGAVTADGSSAGHSSAGCACRPGRCGAAVLSRSGVRRTGSSAGHSFAGGASLAWGRPGLNRDPRTA